MKKVPYYSNPNNDWCALACYVMVGQYLLPDAGITFGKFKKLADAREGYVVWAFPVWSWLMDHGIIIHDQDVSSNEMWLKDGVDGLRNSVSEKEFAFYEKNTYDLNQVTNELRKTSSHPNFTYTQKHVTWNEIIDSVKQPGICDMTLNGRLLDTGEGFSVHRVVLIDITDKEVIFHNPNVRGDGAYQRKPIVEFRKAVESLSGPELCHYSVAS